MISPMTAEEALARLEGTHPALPTMEDGTPILPASADELGDIANALAIEVRRLRFVVSQYEESAVNRSTRW